MTQLLWFDGLSFANLEVAPRRNVPNQLNRKQFVERLDQLGFQGMSLGGFCKTARLVSFENMAGGSLRSLWPLLLPAFPFIFGACLEAYRPSILGLSPYSYCGQRKDELESDCGISGMISCMFRCLAKRFELEPKVSRCELREMNLYKRLRICLVISLYWKSPLASFGLVCPRIDRATRMNVGYAFVNFVDSESYRQAAALVKTQPKAVQPFQKMAISKKLL